MGNWQVLWVRMRPCKYRKLYGMQVYLLDSNWATIVGIVTLVIGATGVFSEIQDSINQIWHLKAKPYKGRGWLHLIINRLFSFSMVITLGFLLLVSLVINGLMDFFLDAFGT